MKLNFKNILYHFKKRKEVKVFCVGMYKTGTTSMGRAFNTLGYKTLHGPWTKPGLLQDPWNERPEEWVDQLELLRSGIEKYDAFQDYPWMFCYKHVYRMYPNSRFILLERDPEEVAQSDLNMWKKRRRDPPMIPPKARFMNRYINHFEETIEFFSDKPDHLLVMNLRSGDGWEKLCPFLGEPPKTIPFPHSNKGRYRKAD